MGEEGWVASGDMMVVVVVTDGFWFERVGSDEGRWTAVSRRQLLRKCVLR